MKTKLVNSSNCAFFPAARYYNSLLSIWLSVDPLADKYPNLSPYTYCANNPVRLVDPDGRTIVDEDGNECYDSQKGWLENAPEDTKRIGNAMMNSETGQKQFNKLVESNAKIQIKTSQDIITSDDGLKKMGHFYSIGYFDNNGDFKLQSGTIVVFEKAINEYKDKLSSDFISQLLSISATTDEYMAAVAGHEAEHATSQINLNMSNKKNADYDIELIPNQIKFSILMEFFLKKY